MLSGILSFALRTAPSNIIRPITVFTAPSGARFKADKVQHQHSLKSDRERAMKADIHPKYMECKVTCGCGHTFMTGGTVPEIRIEICSDCHPFYTGKQKYVDSAGRVDRFRKKFGENALSAAANKK
jgi:large subunit ribosomal protein L31